MKLDAKKIMVLVLPGVFLLVLAFVVFTIYFGEGKKKGMVKFGQSESPGYGQVEQKPEPQPSLPPELKEAREPAVSPPSGPQQPEVKPVVSSMRVFPEQKIVKSQEAEKEKGKDIVTPLTEEAYSARISQLLKEISLLEKENTLLKLKKDRENIARGRTTSEGTAVPPIPSFGMSRDLTNAPLPGMTAGIQGMSGGSFGGTQGQAFGVSGVVLSPQKVATITFPDSRSLMVGEFQTFNYSGDSFTVTGINSEGIYLAQGQGKGKKELFVPISYQKPAGQKADTILKFQVGQMPPGNTSGVSSQPAGLIQPSQSQAQ